MARAVRTYLHGVLLYLTVIITYTWALNNSSRAFLSDFFNFVGIVVLVHKFYVAKERLI